MTAGLDPHHMAILRALAGFTDYVTANAVHRAAFPHYTTPSIEGVSRRLVTLYKGGRVERSMRDGKWKYAITSAGREAMAGRTSGKGGEA